MKLSYAQYDMLMSMPPVGVKHVVSYNQTAKVLVRMDLAYWNRDDKLALTPKGLVFRHDLLLKSGIVSPVEVKGEK